MTYDHSKFAYEQPDAWLDWSVIGKRYNDVAIILDATWADDDNMAVLMVEDDEDLADRPFVIFTVNLDALDVRTELARYKDLRDATIMFDSDFR